MIVSPPFVHKVRVCVSPEKPRFDVTRQRCCRVHELSHRGLRVADNSRTTALTSTMHELPQPPKFHADVENKQHLLVMANGLFGSSSNWDVVIDNLQKVLDISQTVLVASDANSLMQTFDGIDSCGDRLTSEIQQKVKQYPSLNKISLLGHSMGGLLVRYAAGKLYDPSSRLICGLKPAHFLTLATPHMGCDGEGPAQVPFIGWTGDVPLAGRTMQRLLQSMAKPFVSTFMRHTGRQFFMHDTDNGRQPLLVRMSQDSAQDGYFLAALDSFVTRTCYANAAGDHLVGWANSSIRHPDELPVISPKTKLRGVIREDPLHAALHPHHAASFLQQHNSTSARSESAVSSEEKCSSSTKTQSQPAIVDDGLHSQKVEADQSCRAHAQDAGLLVSHAEQTCSGVGALQVGAASQQYKNHEADYNIGQSSQQHQAEEIVSSSADALRVLRKLQSLPWRRVDVSFQHSSLPFFAHNHIQVTRKWLNWEGAAVCEHLARQLADMEKDPCIQRLIESQKTKPQIDN